MMKCLWLTCASAYKRLFKDSLDAPCGVIYSRLALPCNTIRQPQALMAACQHQEAKRCHAASQLEMQKWLNVSAHVARFRSPPLLGQALSEPTAFCCGCPHVSAQSAGAHIHNQLGPCTQT